jgi:hypothetical protein
MSNGHRGSHPQAKHKGKEVVVANSCDQAVPVRVVDQGPKHPLHRQFALDWPDGIDEATGTYVVPADKRLVVEYASLFAYLPSSGQSMFIRIVTTVNGDDAFHNLAVRQREDYGVLKQFDAGHVVKIYADSGSTVQIKAGRTPFTGPANATLTLSGHLVDVP